MIHIHTNVEEFAGREAEKKLPAAEMGVIQKNIVLVLINRRERALELVDMSMSSSMRLLVGILQKLVLIQRKLRLTCWIS